jgi:hypothetical protein
LRSRDAGNPQNAANVNSDGEVNRNGWNNVNNDGGVRPALPQCVQLHPSG